MIRFAAQERIQKWLASGLLAAAMRFHRDKYRIDFGELFRIVEAENPAAVRFAVHVQDTEIGGVVFLARFDVALTPDLKRAGSFPESVWRVRNC